MNKKIHKYLQLVMVVFDFKRSIGDNEGMKFTTDGDFIDLNGNVHHKETHDAYIPYEKAVSLMWQMRNESFDDGVAWQKNQGPRLKPLVFDRGTAYTPIKTYDIEFHDEDRTFDVWIEGQHYESFNTEPEAIEYCNRHYRELIESCYSNVHD